MKALLVLPLIFAASSCIYPEPYEYRRPPYREGGPHYPHARQGESFDGPPSETGRYEPLPGPNGEGSPSSRPMSDSRPTSPRIDDDLSPSESNPPPAPEPKPGRPEYPVGEASDKPGRVKSPYPPYTELDRSDIKSGGLAKDPTTGKIFRVP